MTDPLRSGRPPASPEGADRDRDARVEELLLTGLDHYFSGQHDLAVNVWTRVLFLDRGHARARAYIERARSAIAERQREGEELLHTGVAAFQRGDQTAARALLKSALDRGAGGEEAMALLQRIDRLETAPLNVETARHVARSGRELPVSSADHAGGSRLLWIVAGVVGGVLLAALGLMTLGDQGAQWFGLVRDTRATTPARPEEPLPVPTASELSLSRARALRARGHLREALGALDAIGYGDRLQEQADELRAGIQQDLLTAARASRRSGSPAGSSPPQ
ncbi:MAG: hypothetical protein WBC51_09190 [Vicinamibacterales bacterium]